MTVETIWKEYRFSLVQFVARRISDPETVSDIVQIIFEKISLKIDSLHSSESLKSWLYQIARNSIIDFYRTNKPTVELHDIASMDEDATTKELKELSKCLIPMINSFAEPYKSALMYSEIEGKSHKEIAAVLAISVSGSKSRVQRGRRQLKEKLSSCCELEFDCKGNLSGFDLKPDSCSDMACACA